ncbi:outer membrane protein assembly factor BamB family protein [Thalassoroseus pseudoceratinae]|uniref:outer membrane protein assembly factor BamB family protein n=1 Tax=Thalassoroseus pseudoceratinae TaxID=2713176 RepID=UPI001420FF6C|nr:PQQ-binding-like beta-propeller repeat protein [Thalassoroseus pseudoceratinae]
MNRLLPILCIALLTAFALPAGAEDWTTWRGPNRDGLSQETGLLSKWPANGPKLLWQIDQFGRGYSSVAISKDLLFTMGKRKGPAELMCLNLKTGRGVWATPVGDGDPNCTPTVDPEAGLVYALGRQGDLVCCRVTNGQVVWRKSFRDDFGGKMMSGWGYSESPLLDGDKLICTPGSTRAELAALDKKTGRVIWSASAAGGIGDRGGDGAGYSSPVISHAADRKQYVQLTGRGIISVDAETGAVLWTYNKIANGTANIPTPIVKDDYVFCSTGYGTGAALLKIVRDGDGLRAEEQYFLDSKTFQNHHGGMVLVGDYIYCGHGHNKGFPMCLELETGKVMWDSVRGPGSGSAAVVFADGNLYFRYENGVMALIEATPEEYRLQGSFELAAVHGKSWPHPVIHEGRLYLRDQQSLMCYDIRAKSR